MIAGMIKVEAYSTCLNLILDITKTLKKSNDRYCHMEPVFISENKFNFGTFLASAINA